MLFERSQPYWAHLGIAKGGLKPFETSSQVGWSKKKRERAGALMRLESLKKYQQTIGIF